MLSIHVITVGRDKDRWVTDQIEHYTKLLSRYARIELISVPETKYGKNTDLNRARADEAAAIRNRLTGGFVVALEVEGKQYDTTLFASWLADLQTRGHSLLEFVIGGPHGLDPAFVSDRKISLSPLTMSHQIVRLVLLEQLYRVLNLNTGGSYHK